jgi:aspartate racemase
MISGLRPGSGQVLGIIGGIGPESTIDYYRLLVSTWKQTTGAQGAPRVLINSIDLGRLLALVESSRLEELTGYLLDELGRLSDAGADIALMAANTPHIVFDELRKKSPVPLLSIVEATCEEARRLDLRCLGLIGTRFTMQGDFYPSVFRRAGLQVARPEGHEMAVIHKIYVGQLLRGEIRLTSRRQILRIIRAMIQRSGIDGVILAGTELSLLFPDRRRRSVPFLSTTRIHVRAAIQALQTAPPGMKGEMRRV